MSKNAAVKSDAPATDAPASAAVPATPAPPAAPAPAAPAPAPAPNVRVLNPARIKETHFRPDTQGYHNTHWKADIVRAHSFDDIGKTDYWSHVARNIKTDDRISAFAEDGSWYAELLVRDRGDNWAKVAVLSKHDFAGIDNDLARETNGYKVEYRGRIDKFSVIRVSDGEPVHRGYNSEIEARNAMADYLKTLRR